MLANRLVVALDYGTTYTGVAFCETSDTGVLEKHIDVVKDWPSRHTKIGTKEKVPSEIAYLPEGTQWGSLIAPNVQRHMWTKLELDSAQIGEAAKIVRELSLNNQGPDKKAVDIVADFLAHVKDHLIQNLDNRYGKELWKTLPITLVVTVPAVWSDAAKDRTLKAVRKAGFDTTEFPKLKRTITTTEPEAAAIHTIQSLRGSVSDEQFAIGDGFIVCDMGGGTVDLISYRVAELEPTILEEATVGIGEQCGGSFVDRGFLRWLERRLGTADFIKIAGERSEDLPRTSLSSKLGRMAQDFVMEAKSGFSGEETNFLRLPTPLSAIEEDEARGICDGEIEITRDDMKEMFEMPLRNTYELLLQQMQQARKSGNTQMKYIFMVGGFAESPYMYKKIQTFAEANGLQAIRPPNAWSAIVRGAVAKGLEGDGRAPIKNRKCRRNYGTDCCCKFIAGVHKATDAFIDSYTGIKSAENQMNWLVTKGQDLSTSDKAYSKVSFTQTFWPGEERTASVDLIASDAETAPKRSVEKVRLSSKNDVYTVATLKVDLSDVPQHLFKYHINPAGKEYYVLRFDVKIAIQSSLEFSLVVNGKEYGSVVAKYA
ncbi:hypothetical protein BDU57DRAFT_485781 [Ampelomyces quisqualis]|uniref:Hsp70 family protein n=1 Tax=Ampelomyces quisqualis TaxID=50730 RepID=A0A6A5Q9E8_AMPQU|nr:hypothetical protein BDU57DRAFT_485781 [Ampelomyces quisqualis]